MTQDARTETDDDAPKQPEPVGDRESDRRDLKLDEASTPEEAGYGYGV